MSGSTRRLLLTLLLAGNASAASAQVSVLPTRQVRRIDSLFAAFDRPGSPGYAVGVIRDGRLVYAKGFGRADLDHDIPITPRTSFHLASLSKQFTAAAVALLILDGKLSLETRVDSIIPEVARFGGDLRVKHLMYFTSGLPEYTALPRANGTPWFSSYYFTIDEAIATTLRATSLRFAPGTRWEYSNVDFMLLARIAERVSGMPLSELLARRLFAPLGMANTSLNDDATAVVPGRATGYAPRDDASIRGELHSVGIDIHAGPGFARMIRNSPHYGGSGVFSSIEDLARWNDNFDTHRVGGAAFTRLMLTRTRFAHSKDNDAFGLVFGSFGDQEMIWFSGGDLDTSTYMARLPGIHTTVIVLSNMPTGNAEAKARAILGILLPGSR